MMLGNLEMGLVRVEIGPSRYGIGMEMMTENLEMGLRTKRVQVWDWSLQ